MIYTGYYGGLSHIVGDITKVQVSNSAPVPVDIRFEKAIPDWAFIVKPYKDGLITKEEYEERYTLQLDKFRENILGVTEYFNSTGKDYILLCYEKPGDFCHRHILADYINKALGEGIIREYVPEIHNQVSTTLF
jgi:hypothetical protein